MLGGNVVDQLHDDDGLAHTGAAEQADLTATQIRLQQIDDLDAGLEHLQAGILLLKGGSMTMNWVRRCKLNRALLVDRIADDVHDTAQRPAANGNRNRSAGVYGLHAADKAVGRLHGNRANAALAQVLLNFRHDVDGCRDFKPFAGNPDCGVNRRQILLVKGHVHNRANHLNYFANIHVLSSAVRDRQSLVAKSQLPNVVLERQRTTTLC